MNDAERYFQKQTKAKHRWNRSEPRNNHNQLLGWSLCTERPAGTSNAASEPRNWVAEPRAGTHQPLVLEPESWRRERGQPKFSCRARGRQRAGRPVDRTRVAQFLAEMIIAPGRLQTCKKAAPHRKTSPLQMYSSGARVDVYAPRQEWVQTRRPSP